MYSIKSLDDVRGNNVVVYSIKTLLERKSFPKLSIMSGVMGVGKTSVARVVASILDSSGAPTKVYNFGMDVDMSKVQEEVFTMNPSAPKVFLFEEIHGLPKADQNALLQMFDSQFPNVYVICTTTEIHKVIRPIRSRAQVWDFKLLSVKQLNALLDDYLKLNGKTLQDESKRALVRAARGVPRDLIKNTDFALEGQFSTEDLNTLLGNISDTSIFTIFCALKSDSSEFVAGIDEMLEDQSYNRLEALRDFWLRYILERKMRTKETLGDQMISTLDTLYTEQDISKVSKVLLRSTPSSMLLELVTLNMTFNCSTPSALVGQQKETARSNESIVRRETPRADTAPRSVYVNSNSIRDIKL